MFKAAVKADPPEVVPFIVLDWLFVCRQLFPLRLNIFLIEIARINISADRKLLSIVVRLFFVQVSNWDADEFLIALEQPDH